MENFMVDDNINKLNNLKKNLKQFYNNHEELLHDVSIALGIVLFAVSAVSASNWWNKKQNNLQYAYSLIGCSLENKKDFKITDDTLLNLTKKEHAIVFANALKMGYYDFPFASYMSKNTIKSLIKADMELADSNTVIHYQPLKWATLFFCKNMMDKDIYQFIIANVKHPKDLQNPILFLQELERRPQKAKDYFKISDKNIKQAHQIMQMQIQKLNDNMKNLSSSLLLNIQNTKV